jgi:hypothetical protein
MVGSRWGQYAYAKVINNIRRKIFSRPIFFIFFIFNLNKRLLKNEPSN